MRQIIRIFLAFLCFMTVPSAFATDTLSYAKYSCSPSSSVLVCTEAIKKSPTDNVDMSVIPAVLSVTFFCSDSTYRMDPGYIGFCFPVGMPIGGFTPSAGNIPLQLGGDLSSVVCLGSILPAGFTIQCAVSQTDPIRTMWNSIVSVRPSGVGILSFDGSVTCPQGYLRNFLTPFACYGRILPLVTTLSATNDRVYAYSPSDCNFNFTVENTGNSNITLDTLVLWFDRTPTAKPDLPDWTTTVTISDGTVPYSAPISIVTGKNMAIPLSSGALVPAGAKKAFNICLDMTSLRSGASQYADVKVSMKLASYALRGVDIVGAGMSSATTVDPVIVRYIR